MPDDRAEGLNEGNVSDKPRFIREAPPLTPSELHTYRVYYEKQLEALRGVDDGVKDIVDTLGAAHRLRNTYILFTSDNGFFFGQHRLAGGKFLAYQPSTHLPLLIRGPGIKPGSSSNALVANVDIAPTIAELAGVKPDMSVDGVSLAPYFHDPSLSTRRPILFESFVETNDVEEDGGRAAAGASGRVAKRGGSGAHASILAPPKNYEGVRLGPYKYIAWPNGEKELYDIEKDPNELNNLIKVPDYYPVRNFLDRETKRLEACSGKSCQEEAAEIPLTRKELQRKRAEERREKQQSHKG
jgi:N-acetylglucosamine-6-sulfatase